MKFLNLLLGISALVLVEAKEIDVGSESFSDDLFMQLDSRKKFYLDGFEWKLKLDLGKLAEGSDNKEKAQDELQLQLDFNLKNYDHLTDLLVKRMHTDFLNEFQENEFQMVSEPFAAGLISNAKYQWDRNGYVVFRKMYDAAVKQYEKDI